mgnify:FL=1
MEFDLKRVLIGICAVLMIAFLVYQIYNKQDISNQEEKTVLYEPVLSDTLESVLYYENDRKYYLYGLEEVMVTYQDETKQLKEFLSDGVSIEDLTFQMEHNSAYDGGSTLYRNDDVSILVCHRIIPSGGYNEDVYIGNSDMGYEEGFCE